jgi:hypothetical protein
MKVEVTLLDELRVPIASGSQQLSMGFQHIFARIVSVQTSCVGHAACDATNIIFCMRLRFVLCLYRQNVLKYYPALERLFF